MKIVIIGTGNVAAVLGRLMLKAGVIVSQVYGRNEISAKQLAEELKSDPCSAWNDIRQDADIYLVALTDQSLLTLPQHLHLGERLVVHTAGAVERAVLRGVSQNYGVMYPLQTLRKEMKVLTEIPFLVDGNNERSKDAISSLAARISGNVSWAGDAERLKLHLAAVFVNNFTNRLYEVAYDYCRQEHINFSLLQPLAMETAGRLGYSPPAAMATGPAARKDLLTIESHLKLLALHPDMRDLYTCLTDSILHKDKLRDNEMP